jgi:hypothetical protein
MLTAEQLEARKGKMTSSIVAGALGMNPSMTPLDAWMRVTGRLPPLEPNKAMDRGNRLEELVLDYPCDTLDLVRRAAPFRAHPNFVWAGDSADALYLSGDSLRYAGEGKTVSGGVEKHYKEEGTDDIHPGALVQSHWHLIHWPEVDTCLVPVLVGGYTFEFRLYYVRRDAEFEGCLMEDAARWHRDYVVADKQPPAADPRDIDNLLMLHPRHTKGLLDPTDEIEFLARGKDEARFFRKEYEDKEEKIKLRLIEILGDHEGVQGEGWSIRFRQNKNSKPKVDYESICKSLNVPEDIIAQYTRIPAGNRPLVVTIKGDK